MELGSLLLLLLLPPADAASDLAGAVQAALYRDLGQVAIAVVPDENSARATWQDLGGRFKSRFVGRLVWKDSLTASVDVYSGPSKATPRDLIKTRDVFFARVDSSRERGRAIGLVLVQLLRELPSSAIGNASAEVAAAPAPDSIPPHAFIVSMDAERVSSGNWGLGPELSVAHSFVPALRVRGFGLVLLGSQDSYSEFGAGVGVTWFFWRQAARHRALGLEGDLGLCRDAAAPSGDSSASHATLSGSLRAAVTGYVHVSNRLFIGATAGLKALSNSLSYRFGEDPNTYRSYPLLRPYFSFGAGFSF